MPGPTFLELARSIDRQLQGNIQYPSRAIVFGDSPFSITPDHDWIQADASGGNMSVLLPDATLVKGMPFGIKKTDASTNTVTVQSAVGGQKIDGAATKVLVNQNDYMIVVSDGTDYQIYSLTISASATGGAIYYQIEKIVKTDGVSTLVPVDGTLLNFTVAVDGECAFWAGGDWSGNQIFAGGSLNFRVDGVDYAPESFGLINGAGGDTITAQSLSPHISLFLTAGPHTVELVASQAGIGLNASAGTPLTLSVLFPGASSSVATPTPKAATLVVHPTPGIGDYTTIQNALNAIVALGGGYVLVREGSYDEQLTFPADIPIVMRGCGDDTVIAPTAAGEVFAFPNGLSQFTYVVLEDLKVTGDPTIAQTAFAYKDTSAFWRVITNRVQIEGVRKIDDVQAADTTYVNLFEVHHYRPNFIPTATAANNVLCDTAGAAGALNAPIGIHYHDAKFTDEMTASATGWHWDFDGDMIYHGVCWTNLGQNSDQDGLEVEGSLIAYTVGAVQLELHGASWPSAESVLNLTLIGALTVKLSGIYPGVWTNVLTNGSGCGLIVNSNNWDLNVNSSVSAQHTGVTVDILAGADDVRIGGNFGDAVLAAIRTAALRTIVKPSNFNMTAGCSVLEAGSADFTQVVTGSTGLTTGGSISVIGASSTINGNKTNVSYSSTADAYATVCLNTNPKSFVGIGSIQNTHATRSLTIKETVVDLNGNTASLETVVPALSQLLLDTMTGFVSGGVGTAYPPYVSYKAEVKSTTAGQSATYLFNFLGQGAVV